MVLLVVLLLFIVLDLAALIGGADSRPPLRELPRRSI